MSDPAGLPVLDLDAPERAPAVRRRPRRARPRSARARRLRRGATGAALLAALASGALGQHLARLPAMQRSGQGSGQGSGHGWAPTDSAGVAARYQRSYDSVHVKERTDTALAEFTSCAAAAGVPTGQVPGVEQASSTALCRSAYRVTVRAIYADLARAAAATAP